MTEADLRVRFDVDDVELSALHARAFAHPSTPEELSVRPWATRLERHSVTWVGAFSGAELVGFVHACWDGGLHAFLLDTVVAPEHRHLGVGSAVVELLVAEVRAAGCHWLHVDFEPALEPFYSAVGFGPTDAGLMNLTRSSGAQP